MKSQAPRAERGSGTSLGAFAMLLDSDGDGDVKDDVAKMGMGLLNRFLKRRR